MPSLRLVLASAVALAALPGCSSAPTPEGTVETRAARPSEEALVSGGGGGVVLGGGVGVVTIIPTLALQVPSVARLQDPNASFVVPVTLTGTDHDVQGTLTLNSSVSQLSAVPLPVTVPAWGSTVANLTVDLNGFYAFYGDLAHLTLEVDFTSAQPMLSGTFDLRVYPKSSMTSIADWPNNCVGMGLGGQMLLRPEATIDLELWFGDATTFTPDPTQAILLKAYWRGSAIAKGIFPKTQYSRVLFNAPMPNYVTPYDPSMYPFIYDDETNWGSPPNAVTFSCTLVSPSTQFSLAPPTVTNVTPNAGSIYGGTAVVTGTGFDNVDNTTRFFFGSAPATNVSCPTTTSCSMTYPPGNAMVDVTASVNHFVSAINVADQFRYMPSVLSVVPSHANIGDTVTVNGIGVGVGTTTIAFGGVAATNVVCGGTDGQWCTATVPGGSGTVDVVATVGGTSSRKTAADLFTYNAPTITYLSQNRGPVNGGAIVGIAGTGFTQCPMNNPDPAVQVFFGSVPATQVLCGQNFGQLVAYAPPASAPGPVHVTLTAFGVTSAPTAADVFTYTTYDQVHYFDSEWNGAALTAYLTLDAPEPASTVFTLTTSDATSVVPPAQVTVLAGQASLSFPLTVLSYNAASPPTITAWYDGLSFPMVVSPPPPPPPVCNLRCPAGSSLDEADCVCFRCRGTTCF